MKFLNSNAYKRNFENVFLYINKINLSKLVIDFQSFFINNYRKYTKKLKNSSKKVKIF